MKNCMSLWSPQIVDTEFHHEIFMVTRKETDGEKVKEHHECFFKDTRHELCIWRSHVKECLERYTYFLILFLHVRILTRSFQWWSCIPITMRGSFSLKFRISVASRFNCKFSLLRKEFPDSILLVYLHSNQFLSWMYKFHSPQKVLRKDCGRMMAQWHAIIREAERRSSKLNPVYKLTITYRLL